VAWALRRGKYDAIFEAVEESEGAGKVNEIFGKGKQLSMVLRGG
jgi:hypothetical protein